MNDQFAEYFGGTYGAPMTPGGGTTGAPLSAPKQFNDWRTLAGFGS